MKLATKLSLSLGIFAVQMVGLGVFCLMQMASINGFTTAISNEWIPRIILAENLRLDADSYRREQMRHLIARTPEEMAGITKELTKIANNFNERLEQLKAAMDMPEARRLISEVETLWSGYRKDAVEILHLSEQKRGDEAMPLLTGEARKKFLTINDQLSVVSEMATSGAESASATASSAYDTSRFAVFALIAIAVVVAVGINVVIVRNTLRQLGKEPGELGELAAEVAGGRLDIERDPNAVGVYAEILTMVESLKKNIENAHKESERAQEESSRAQEALRQADEASKDAQAKRDGMLKAAVRLEEVAGIVSSASTELSSQIELSEQGAAEQAARVTETATAMEEMNSTVLEVARNAGAASEVSSATRERAEQGAQAVQEVVAGIRTVQETSLALKGDMGKLTENAQAISRIMAVISDIADQTNLLALNAAIEAARAGEAGRGFAVVADEVRKLAEKTMASTHDVSNAINAIQESTAKSTVSVDNAVARIEEATQFANESGRSLEDIVATAETTADQVNAIATASEEQSAASEEINHSILHCNDMSRLISDAMNEAARAVSHMAEQAQSLARLVESMKHD